MDLNVELLGGVSLKLVEGTESGDGYPTARLCKGLILVHDGQELDEEGVGFGVPVVKLGFKTIFSGEMNYVWRVEGSVQDIVAVYSMNLEEKLAHPRRGSVNSKVLYAAKNSLAELYRRNPVMRGLLTQISNALRTVFGWETTFQEVSDYGKVRVTHRIDLKAGMIAVTVDTTGLLGDGITEVVVMNEQGARWFDQYRDSSGTFLRGNEIGNWDEVSADEATFVSGASGLSFSLGQVPGARLLRGRELVGSRLAWAGFGYSFAPHLPEITYRLRIEKLA